MIPITPPAIHAPATVCPDRARFLACIAAVETRRNKKLGAHGEKGRYQFTRSTWESLTSLPFSAADDDMHADQVAAFYFNKLRYGLLSRGLDVTVRNLAVAWNGGVNSVILHKWANADVRDYGVRVEALYDPLAGFIRRFDDALNAIQALGA